MNREKSHCPDWRPPGFLPEPFFGLRILIAAASRRSLPQRVGRAPVSFAVEFQSGQIKNAVELLFVVARKDRIGRRIWRCAVPGVER